MININIVEDKNIEILQKPPYPIINFKANVVTINIFKYVHI